MHRTGVDRRLAAGLIRLHRFRREVLLWICRELRATPRSAEKIFVTHVFRAMLRVGAIDLHAAHGIALDRFAPRYRMSVTVRMGVRVTIFHNARIPRRARRTSSF